MNDQSDLPGDSVPSPEQAGSGWSSTAPTPAEHLSERRLLQLQLLTRRNAPSPTETWAQDVAQVLGGAHDEKSARRLQAALKALLKR